MTDKETVATPQPETPAEAYSPLHRPGDFEATWPISGQDPKCPNCGRSFDSDEWDVRHLTGGPSIGAVWMYTCPKCNNETLECST